MKIINKLKEYKIFIIALLLAILVFNIKLPYYVMAPGGIINLNERISYQDLNGNINMLYVSEYDGTVASLFMASIFKEWDIYKLEEKQVQNESSSEIYKRNRIMLDNSLQNALFVAYTNANKEIKIKDKQNIVLAKVFDNDFEIGDIILTVDGNNLENIDMLKQIIASKKENDILTFKVLRNNKEIEIEAKIKVEDKKNVIGIIAVTNYDYELNPEIELKFKASESGSSGGLMLALSIYDALSDEDLLKGRTIAGTGTIDMYGNVGEIDGVKYKLMGAVKNKINIVFVPSGNYNEAISVKKKYNYDIDIVKVDTFEDALNYLRNN